jgi:hypothetical protein
VHVDSEQERRRPPRRAFTAAAIAFACAYVLLSAAWIFANPPYAAPDEWTHFIRASSIGHGQLIGEQPEGPILGEPPAGADRRQHEAQERWLAQNTRIVTVPANSAPDWGDCSAAVPAICYSKRRPPLALTRLLNTAGNYQPFPYFFVAPVTRLDAAPERLDRAMRTLKAAVALALLAIAFLALWVPGHRGLAALGLLGAITPMVVFLGASLNPSGLEIAGAIAFVACLLRLARNEPVTRLVWLGLGLGGAVMVLSRSTAPFWVFLDFAIFFGLTGVRPGLQIVRRGGLYAAAALGAIFAAIVLNRIWELLYGPHLTLDPTPLGSALHAGWQELAPVLDQQVGVFGYLEVEMAPLAYLAWLSATIALVAIAALLGDRRERLVVGATAAAAFFLPILLVAGIMRHTGWGLQGRYVLAFSVVVPLLAGEIVFRHRDSLVSLRATALALPFAAIVAAVHLHALYANGRRYAVGLTGPTWFPGSEVWSPVGGWLPWLTVAVLAAAALALAPALDRRR